MNQSTDPSPGPWAGLQRRKLVQWLLAYAAGAWVLLQVLGLLSSTYGWSPAAMRIAVGAVAVGFLVALVLAWFHGERGAQRVGGMELAILTLLLAIGGFALWRMEQGREPGRTRPRSPRRAAPRPHPSTAPIPNSIAVLPFVDMSQGKDQEYLSDGIAEELLNMLAKVRELRVTSRSSAFSFKGKEVDVPYHREALNVSHVLEGSVRKSGNQVRVTVQLIEAGSDTHLWSETYDRKLDDIFAIQDEIAASVVAQLKLSLLGAVPKAAATDPAAYALFLQGRQLERDGSAESFARAVDLYREVLARAPGYAPAWERLGSIYQYQGGRGLRPADEAAVLARQAVERALALDPNYAPALADRGFNALLAEHDVATAARDIGQAMALEPGNSEILRSATRVAIVLDRIDLAVALGRQFVEIDPANANARGMLCRAYWHGARYDEATACYQRVLELSPNIVGIRHYLASVLLLKGGRENAEAALALSAAEPQETYRLYSLAMAKFALGDRAGSDAALAEVERKYARDAGFNIAYTYAYRGEPDLAFAWLDKAAEHKDTGLPDIAVNKLFKPLHGDPRWLAFLTRLGFAPDQLAAIRFDVAAPVASTPRPN
jgi:TolB-like protein/Flp pilus assembly protein TadD